MRTLRFGSVALVLGAFLMFSGPVGGATSGGCSSPSKLVPTLRDITINQGLQTYSTLVRGKETLVRLYLSLPSCAATGNAVRIDGVTLTMTLKDAATGASVGSAQTFSPTPALGLPAPQITNLYGNPPLAQVAPSDPMFVVPGSAIAPSGDTNRLTATFSATINWTPISPSGSSVSGTALTSTVAGTSMSKTVETATRALRLLVVPMGGLLDAAGTTAIQNGMTTLSRVYPVPDGTGGSGVRVGSLTGTTGGIRYAINNSFLDLSALNISLPFCGTATNFGSSSSGLIDTQLSQFRQSWNSANPTTPADNVVGAIGESQSIGSAQNTSCDEARAAVNGRESWVRAESDKTTTLATGMGTMDTTITVSSTTTGFPTTTPFNVLVDNEIVQVTALSGTTWTVTRGAAATHAAGATVALLSDTGALMAMEIEHNYGYVPLSRGDANYHSLYAHADHNTGDANRGYNVTGRQFLPDNRSNMRFTPPGWTNLNVLLEPQDWADMLCNLGGATTSECTTSGTTGTAAAGAGATPVPSFVMSGTTDGTPAGTTVLESYTAATTPTPIDSSSPYHLVQLAGGTVLRDDTVPVSFNVSNHTDSEPSTVSSIGLFSVAVPLASGTTRIEFRNASTVLYSVNQQSSAPTITGSTITSSTPPGPPFTQCPQVGQDTSCRLLIYYNADGSIQTLTDTGEVPAYDGLEDTLIGVQNDTNHTITSTDISATAPVFGFDGDGICTFTSDITCTWDHPTGYEGPGTTFSNISGDHKSGTVNYGSGIPPGGHAYFSLEDAVDVSQIAVTPPITYTITSPGTTVTSDLYLQCQTGGVFNVVRVGITGTSVSIPQNVGCPGGEFYAVAHDGFSSSGTPTPVGKSTLTDPPTLPFQPSVASPTPGQSYSVNDDIALVGSAFDYSTGTPATLQWKFDGNSIPSATGQQFDVRASTLGVGSHTITLMATAGKKSASVNVPITISADADGDGVAAPQEAVIQACAASKGITDGGDNDPANGNKDYDGDGIPNRDDPFPCTPAGSYVAASAAFVPNPLSLSGSGALSAGGIYVPFRNMTQVTQPKGGLPSVYITAIDLGEKGTIPVNEQASSYTASGSIGAATFARQPLIGILSAHGLVNRTVNLTITGNAVDPVSGSWSFTALISVYVTN